MYCQPAYRVSKPPASRPTVAPAAPVSSLVVLTLRGNRVCLITRFGDRGLFARFGLPRTLARD